MDLLTISRSQSDCKTLLHHEPPALRRPVHLRIVQLKIEVKKQGWDKLRPIIPRQFEGLSEELRLLTSPSS